MTSRKKELRTPLMPASNLPASAPTPANGSSGLTRRGNMERADRSRAAGGPRASTIAPGQPSPAQRQKDKCVPLSDTSHEPTEHTLEKVSTHRVQQLVQPSFGSFGVFEDLETGEQTSNRGPITVFCVAETLDLQSLQRVVRMRHPSARLWALMDVVQVMLEPPESPSKCSVFCFDYGVLVFWNTVEDVEQDLLKTVLQHAAQQELPASEVLADRFQYNYSYERPTMQNDIITVHKQHEHDPQVKLAISHALAQSEKLRVAESRVVSLVLATRSLPLSLAHKGRVPIGSVGLAKLIGELFLQRSAVNLLSSMMDTPEFFWRAPDSLTVLYKRVCEYLELDTRLEVLNTRFTVLTEMLDMLRDQQNNNHTARLEWVVIWLILVECIVGLLMVMGEFGWMRSDHQ